MPIPKFYKPNSMVLVRWVDSAVLGGWRQPALVDFMPGTIESVGYVVEDDAEQLVITTSISRDTGAVLGPLTIPKGCITEIEEIEEDSE